MNENLKSQRELKYYEGFQDIKIDDRNWEVENCGRKSEFKNSMKMCKINSW